MNKMIFGGIVVLVVIGGIFVFKGPAKKTDEAMMSATPSEVMMEKSPSKSPDDMMVKYTGAVLAGTTSPLLDFVQADYDAAVKTDKLVVLYFYANWCPECKKEIPHTYEAFNTLTGESVVGFRVNFNDNETDAHEKALAHQFGVAYQHTKVFVKGGKSILKSPESWDTARYIKEINAAK